MNNGYADAIKEAVTIRQVLEHEGIKTDRNGFACCPLHAEKTASMKVYDNNSFYCYGCNKGGDVIALVRQLHGYGFYQAIQYLDDAFALHIIGDAARSAKNRAEMFRKAKERERIRKEKKAVLDALEADYWALHDLWLETARQVDEAKERAARGEDFTVQDSEAFWRLPWVEVRLSTADFKRREAERCLYSTAGR